VDKFIQDYVVVISMQWNLR